MICPNCNKVIDDDSKFCVYCGTSVQIVTTDSTVSSLPILEETSLNSEVAAGFNQQDVPQPVPNLKVPKGSEKESERKKKSPVMWIITVALVVIAGGTVTFLFLTVFKKPLFNLNDYMYVLDSGFEGYGTVSIGINEKLLRESCRGQFGEKKITESSKTESALLSLMSSGSFDKADHLSNGDNVTYVLDFNKEDIEKQYRIKIEYVPVEYEVSNLQPLTEYDVFDDLVIKVEGYSGIARIYVSYFETVPGINVIWDDSENGNYSNGDVVTFSVQEATGHNLEEYLSSTYGYKLKRTSFEYKIEGLEELVIIDDDLLQYAEIEYYSYPVDAVPFITASVIDTALSDKYPDLELEYYVVGSDRVKNGAEITIGLCTGGLSKNTFENLEELKDYLHQHGYDYNGNVIETIIVSGLAEYITNLSDIPEEAFASVTQDSREYLDDIIASNFEMWRATRPVESMKLIGVCFSVQEDLLDEKIFEGGILPVTVSTMIRNKLYAIFEVKVPVSGETRTIYFYCMWPEWIKESDGTVSYGGWMEESPMGKPELKLDYNGEIVYGFTSVDELIEYIKPENNGWDFYTFETNIPGY